MKNSCKIRLSAFTLVELLVTIMILLILAGLILPAIKTSRGHARDVLCKNNLKELQVAAMTYAFSGGGNLPHSKSTEKYTVGGSPTWTQNNTGWIHWMSYTAHGGNSGQPQPGETPWWGPMGLTCINKGTLWDLVGKNTKPYACPEWAKGDELCGKNDPLGKVLTFDTTNNKPWRCYAMNSQVSGVNFGNIECSKYILFTEAGSTNYSGTTRIADRSLSQKYNNQFAVNSSVEADGWDGSLSCTPMTTNYPIENIGLYHSGKTKANAVFVDGHVEKIAWNVTTNAAAGRW